MPTKLIYLSAYPLQIQQKIESLIEQKRLDEFILSRHPNAHNIKNDKALNQYVTVIKNRYLKKSAPIKKIIYDNKIHVINNALGLHSYVPRIQGSKIKTINEIRISSVFKRSPEALLNMIVVHELAHIKEKDHNKNFYNLCQHMLPDYHQLEFEMRVYLTYLDQFGALY